MNRKPSAAAAVMTTLALVVGFPAMASASTTKHRHPQRIWVPVVVDSFPASSVISGGGTLLTTPFGTWTLAGGTYTVNPGGGLNWNVTTTGTVTGPTVTVPRTRAWSALASGYIGYDGTLNLQIAERPHDTYSITAAISSEPSATFIRNGKVVRTVALPKVSSHRPAGAILQIQASGQRVYAFVDGQPVGSIRHHRSPTTSLHATVTIGGVSTGTLTSAVVEALEPPPSSS